MKFTITLERRQDGGLRVYSDDIPGLMLSGPSWPMVLEDIGPAIRTLLEHNGLEIGAGRVPSG